MKNSLIIFSLIYTCFIFTGCVGDQIYISPTKVDNEGLNQSKNKIETFSIGDTVTNNEVNITLYNIRFVTEIDEQNNQFATVQAEPNKQFAILDIAIENITEDKEYSVSTMLSAKLLDAEGYEYSSGFSAQIALAKSFKDGSVLPGMKRRGELAFTVPIDIEELFFIYEFDIFLGKTAVFKIK